MPDRQKTGQGTARSGSSGCRPNLGSSGEGWCACIASHLIRSTFASYHTCFVSHLIRFTQAYPCRVRSLEPRIWPRQEKHAAQERAEVIARAMESRPPPAGRHHTCNHVGRSLAALPPPSVCHTSVCHTHAAPCGFASILRLSRTRRALRFCFHPPSVTHTPRVAHKLSAQHMTSAAHDSPVIGTGSCQKGARTSSAACKGVASGGLGPRDRPFGAKGAGSAGGATQPPPPSDTKMPRISSA
eukprot:354038-Chlamydomonas_euryale.AAC.2